MKNLVTDIAPLNQIKVIAYKEKSPIGFLNRNTILVRKESSKRKIE